MSWTKQLRTRVVSDISVHHRPASDIIRCILHRSPRQEVFLSVNRSPLILLIRLLRSDIPREDWSIHITTVRIIHVIRSLGWISSISRSRVREE